MRGWGAVCNNIRTGSRWTAEEQMLHINVKELLAIEFGLKALCSNDAHEHIMIFTDNTTAVAYVRKMGGCRSIRCHRVASRIWDWALTRHTWLSIAHLAGIDNTEADTCSRVFNDRTEWQLDPTIFADILKFFNVSPYLDLFASRLNHQLPHYISWNPDPHACGTDAFAMSWHNSLNYAFPPFSLIGRMVQKVVQDRAQVLVVVPQWEAQHWWSQLQQLTVGKVYNLPRKPDILSLPFDRNRTHPLAASLRLQARLISARI